MAETILITGGSQVIRQLASVDSEVNIIGAGHSLQNLEKIIEEDRIKSMQIDFSKPETLKGALKATDRVFLVTPFQPDMVQYSFNLLTEINEVGNIKQIVKLSAIGADDFSVKEGTPSLFNLHGFTSQ